MTGLWTCSGPYMCSDNQDENEGPRRYECEDDGGFWDAKQGRRSGTAGMRWAGVCDLETSRLARNKGTGTT